MTYHDEMPAHVKSPNDAGTTWPSARRTVMKGALWLAASVALLSALMPVTADAATGNASGPVIVNVVTFAVPPAGMASFLKISEQNSRASLKEPGCIGFDVLRPEDQPNSVMLIEKYRNEVAYKSHRVTPHFLAFVKGAQKIGAKRSAVVSRRYYPS